ncbi:MAG: class I SAM-dependent methyltransferase [Dehalococcoidales bacterium]|nr:class I SAM-dependent methyltransferase [Dehalococcoidales bacterium]
MTTSSGREINEWQDHERVSSWLSDEIRQASRQRFREKLVSLLPFQPESAIRVLDIGAGDGVLSQTLLQAYPNAQLVCHDFSEIMLGHARQRLGQFPNAVTFIQGDLRDPAWAQDIEGNFDAIISSVAIHNVAELEQGHPERLQEIYKEIFNLVKPGGCFFNYDHMGSPGQVISKLYRWERFATEQARLKAETGVEKSRQELEQEYQERRHYRQGKTSSQDAGTILEQLGWLKEAGFDEVDCLWKETPTFAHSSPPTIIGGFKY